MNKISIRSIKTKTYLKAELMEVQIVESILYFRFTKKDQQRADEILNTAFTNNTG